MSNAMNDEEVITELKKMVAFIRQEAVEKAREIQVKADEEFAIEKAKIVRQESMNLDTQFDKKKKQVEVSQKMYVYFATNSQRQVEPKQQGSSGGAQVSRGKPAELVLGGARAAGDTEQGWQGVQGAA